MSRSAPAFTDLSPLPLRRRTPSIHAISLAWAGGALVGVNIVGTIGYKIIGGAQASWIDCFYMTFITVATIGYGEMIDLSGHPGGRLFTIAVAFFGIAAMTYMFSTITAWILESDLNQTLRRRRVEKQIDKLDGHYIVCGIGRVGTNVASELQKTEREFVVLEEDLHALELYQEQHPEVLFIHGDAADDDVLARAGIAHAGGVFAVTGDDSRNIVISLSAKQLNPLLRVVARVHDIRNGDKARRAGADEIVSPDFTGGMRIASAMIRPHVVNFMDQMLRRDDGLRVEQVLVPAVFRPRALGELKLHSRDFVLMATHENGRWVFNPDSEHEIRPGHALIVMATPEGREQVEEALRKS
jgi:voltage-gated potassium channel